ncbi:MAG: TRL-like family protein [Bradymonadaceae bacterium]
MNLSKNSLKLSLLVGLIGASFALSGCASVMNPTGILFTSTKASTNHPTNTDTGKDGKALGSKKGKACSNTILYLIGMGDSSLKTAAQNGGIKKVHTVDQSNMAILGGAYVKHCTIVTGE